MITGTDAKSLLALKLFGKGNSIKDVVAELGISQDQAKKLSQYHSFLQQIKHMPESYVKLKSIGLKSLVLAPLFKANDIEGITEVLQAITPDMKRSEIAQMPGALEAKRERVAKQQSILETELKSLSEKETAISQKIAEFKELQKELKKHAKFLDKYGDGIKNFWLEHLGIDHTGKRVVLSRRVDFLWQQNLKKKGIIAFVEGDHWKNEPSYWCVKDMDALAENTEHRIKRGYRLYFDKKHVPQGYPYSISPVYSNAKGFSIIKQKKIAKLRSELKILAKQKEDIQEKIKELRHMSPRSFIESVTIANQLSKKDLEKHARLQNQAMRWLYNQGYVCAAEVAWKNQRWDIVGYNQEGKIIIIEAKSSHEDFLRDRKWVNYLNYCDELYFIFEHWLCSQVVNALEYYEAKELQECGFLGARKKTVEIIQDANVNNKEIREREDIIYTVSRANSSKVIFGY